MQVIRWVVVGLLACGGPRPASKAPQVDTVAFAAELDAAQSELALILHRDRANCPALASNLRTLFARMTASFTHARELQQDPAVAKQLTSDLKRYDARAAERTAAMDADLTIDAPCIRDPAVRDVLMTMPTL